MGTPADGSITSFIRSYLQCGHSQGPVIFGWASVRVCVSGCSMRRHMVEKKKKKGKKQTNKTYTKRVAAIISSSFTVITASTESRMIGLFSDVNAMYVSDTWKAFNTLRQLLTQTGNVMSSFSPPSPSLYFHFISFFFFSRTCQVYVPRLVFSPSAMVEGGPSRGIRVFACGVHESRTGVGHVCRRVFFDISDAARQVASRPCAA